MTGRTPSDDHANVRDLLAELGELVDDLGLDARAPEEVEAKNRERQREHEWLAAVRADLAGVAEELSSEVPPEAQAEAEESDIDLDEDPDLPEHYSMLPGDAAELAALAAAVSGVPGADPNADLIALWESAETEEPEAETVPLWDAFAPELDSQPARAWSPTAAMEVVEPAAPPAPPAPPRTPRLRRIAGAVRGRLFTAVTVAAVLIAAAVLVITRVQLGQTSGPATPVARAAFEVTLMRTVDATSPDGVAQAKGVSTYPAGVTRVFMDVAYRNATSKDTLRLVISLLPPAGSGGTPVQVGDQTHQLPAGGEIAVTIQGPSAGFAPGEYTVTAFHDGHLEQSLTFTVQSPAATPTAAPTATPTAAAPPVAPTP